MKDHDTDEKVQELKRKIASIGRDLGMFDDVFCEPTSYGPNTRSYRAQTPNQRYFVEDDNPVEALRRLGEQVRADVATKYAKLRLALVTMDEFLPGPVSK